MTRQAYRAVVLAAMPGTEAEIKAKTGLGRTTIWRWVKVLHAAGECHISGSKRTGGVIAARYTAGPGRDVPLMRPRTIAERSRTYRYKQRKWGGWEEKLAKQRAAHWADRAKVKGDPLVAAFFGRPT